MNPLPKVSPASAWGVFICGVGVIWTVISYFGMCSGINKMLGEDKAVGFSILVPIWSIIYPATLADLLNEVIQKEGLSVTPVDKPNIFLCLIFIMLPWSNLFTRYNEVASAYEAKHGGVAA